MFRVEPGIYQLTETVQNPKPDKRVRLGKPGSDWTRATEWPEGFRFKVEEGPGGGLTIRPTTARPYESAPLSTTHLAPLYFHLDGPRTDETVEEVISESGWPRRQVFDFLVAQGVLSVADVKSAIAALNEGVDDEGE